jgi:hypothetical protein
VQTRNGHPVASGSAALEASAGWRCGSRPRASVGRAAANAPRFLSIDPVRQAGMREVERPSSHRRAHRRLPLQCARLCGAFVDERRVVVAMEADESTTSGPWSRRSPRAFKSDCIRIL